MSTMERHKLITKALQESGTATVQALADLTGSSGMTIRRDLDALAAQGVLERIHGGAKSLLLRGEEPPFPLRASTAVEAKRKIAEAVVSHIADGETVLLDSGTTCVEIARLLRDREVTVMPLSLQAIHVLGTPPGMATLLVPGGQPRATEGALIGPLTHASIGSLRFDTAILGCCGLTAADGMTAHDLEDAAIKKAGIAASRRVLIATDNSKLGRVTRAVVGPVGDFDLVVVDADVPPEELQALREGGATVQVV